jgi:hypothetical protein
MRAGWQCRALDVDGTGGNTTRAFPAGWFVRPGSPDFRDGTVAMTVARVNSSQVGRPNERLRS